MAIWAMFGSLVALQGKFSYLVKLQLKFRVVALIFPDQSIKLTGQKSGCS